jgi:hypothetical protein
MSGFPGSGGISVRSGRRTAARCLKSGISAQLADPFAVLGIDVIAVKPGNPLSALIPDIVADLRSNPIARRIPDKLWLRHPYDLLRTPHPYGPEEG